MDQKKRKGFILDQPQESMNNITPEPKTIKVVRVKQDKPSGADQSQNQCYRLVVEENRTPSKFSTGTLSWMVGKQYRKDLRRSGKFIKTGIVPPIDPLSAGGKTDGKN